jgi:hypothetical protein
MKKLFFWIITLVVYTIGFFILPYHYILDDINYSKGSNIEAPSVIEMICRQLPVMSFLFVVFFLPAIIIAWYSFYGYTKKGRRMKILHSISGGIAVFSVLLDFRILKAMQFEGEAGAAFFLYIIPCLLVSLIFFIIGRVMFQTSKEKSC